MSEITIWLDGTGVTPVKAEKLRDWWEQDRKTANHAKFCLPLTMAAGLGYFILSPVGFEGYWSGKEDEDVKVSVFEGEGIVDTHSTCGGFTIQPGFIATTGVEGDFLYVRGISNNYRKPYYFLDALIETWWSVGNFGLVALCNQAGSFKIELGEPIAQMFVVNNISADLIVKEGMPNGWDTWDKRRSRPEYERDLDYLQGRTAEGADVGLHYKKCPGRVIKNP